MLFFVQIPKFDYPDDLRQLVARIALVQAVNEQKWNLLYSLTVRTMHGRSGRPMSQEFRRSLSEESFEIRRKATEMPESE